ncbi:hypothetical protein ABIE44_000372 [Marmoricola sp. OAE513]|uniref:hypothetical protein n=1 Tax=Marmoricola sp. OAE513 TaxID=2817894 RepID=UPI001AE84025
MTAAPTLLRRPAPNGAASWLTWSTPPVVAWVAATLLTWAVARATDVAYWSAAGRERWDSTHYLSISRSGYEMFNCWDRAGYKDAGFPDVICGNVAWFPGYPMVVRIFSATGLSYDAAGILVSELALLGMFFALWWLLGSRLTWSTGLTMALGVVFAGGIYFHAVFPIALGTFALLVAVIGVKRGSWLLAGSAGFVAASCHLVGAVVVGMLVLSVFFAWQSDPVRRRVAKALGSAALAASGVLWATWVMWTATGHWDAYEQINRSSYGQGGLRNPFTEFDDARKFDFTFPITPGNDSWLAAHSTGANHWQLWFNLAFVVLVVAWTGWQLVRDRRLEVEQWAAVLLLGAIFLMPFLAGAQMSWYRNHAQMFVGLVLLKNLHPAVKLPVLALFAVQYVYLGGMFFSNVLV